MRVFKIILLSVGALVAMLLIAAVVLYSLASATPKAYRPAQLQPEERRVAAKRFYGAIQQFHNGAEDVLPFTIAVTQDQINAYLASLDEIAADLPGRNPGDAAAKMQEAGFTAPAVALGDGQVTLMARSTEYDMVLSVNLALNMTDDGRLAVRTDGASIGRLAVPGALVRQLGEAIHRSVPAPGDTRDDGDQRASQVDDVGAAVAAVLRAVDGEPIEPICGFSKGRRVRLTDIRIADGKLEMQFAPYGRKVTTRPADD